MAAAHLNRSDLREVQVNFRMNREDREELKARASAMGLSVQAYMEHVLLGRSEVQQLSAGRPVKRQQELPMTG